VKLWDAATGKLLHSLGTKDAPLYFATWNPTNNSFVTKSPNRDVGIWSAETGKLACKVESEANIEKFGENLTFVYSPDGKILLTQAQNDRSEEWGMNPTLPYKGKPKLIAHL